MFIISVGKFRVKIEIIIIIFHADGKSGLFIRKTCLKRLYLYLFTLKLKALALTPTMKILAQKAALIMCVLNQYGILGLLGVWITPHRQYGAILFIPFLVVYISFKRTTWRKLKVMKRHTYFEDKERRRISINTEVSRKLIFTFLSELFL